MLMSLVDKTKAIFTVPFKITAPPSSSSFISILSQENISMSSLYHCTLGLGVPNTLTRNSI